MSNPQTAISQIEKWVSELNEYIQWSCTTESIEALASDVRARWTNLESSDAETLSLALMKNIGLKIIVVGTKTDVFDDLEREESFDDEQFHFIQYHLRKECLQLGAGLVYTSAKSGNNIANLYTEILSQIGFSAKKSCPAVIERSTVNVPMGWDNMKKIDLIKEGLLNIDVNAHWKSIVPNVNMTAKVQDKQKTKQDDSDVIADHQNFLESLQKRLAKTNENVNNATPNGIKTALTSKLTPEASSVSSITSGMTPAGTPRSSQAGGDRALADFFQDLLKKSSAPGGTSPSAPATTRSQTQNPALSNLLNKAKK